MKLQDMEALVGEAVRDADLRPEEIPAIDLYLDQITSLASEKLKEGSPFFSDRVLTKTMINNYSKDGLISPIKGKKYSKEHIVQMLLVYSLKNTLSIGEIKRILQNIYELPDSRDGMLEDVYLRFLEIKEYEREEAWSLLHGFLVQSELDPENEADFFLLILGLASMSSYLKNVVQSLLTAHYPDLEAEREREELERIEEKAREERESKQERKQEVRRQKQEVKRQKQERKAAKRKGAEAVEAAEEAPSESESASDE